MNWGEGFITMDGHAWSLGVDLLRTPRTDTGDTVTLHIQPPFTRDKVAVNCAVCSIPGKTFGSEVLTKEAFVAIGKYRDATVVFQDEDSFNDVLYYINHRKGESL